MTARVLVAGIGNLFLGDDGFGVAVAQELLRSGALVDDDIKIGDYGIRGYDLAYEILEGHESVVLIDATQRGDAPGTLYVIEADPDASVPDLADEPDHGQGAFQGHLMTPAAVFHLVRTMGGTMGRVLVVGCEPETFGPENIGQMELSPVVAAAVPEAVATVERVVRDLLPDVAIPAAAAALDPSQTEVNAR
ncbi:MAG: hydrogenase maturation protease [Candidatus Dormibacteraeota bacterium]|uniref:Hydrogenase maturation protease n=1 Tax=Candidatus Amunia macphersoniae TaxID=3127014 RepID=A0A934NJH9_9BACT|nr:hydrogenase maturation protease [Candidatus Dormibacteraeota bacterium]